LVIEVRVNSSIAERKEGRQGGRERGREEEEEEEEAEAAASSEHRRALRQQSEQFSVTFISAMKISTMVFFVCSLAAISV
jgi:hypothetical protein